DAAEKPIILYNVPGRTGCNILPSTYAKLADHPNIAGIKEANGNISKIVETAALVGDKLDIYSGNDDQIVPIMACGALHAVAYHFLVLLIGEGGAFAGGAAGNQGVDAGINLPVNQAAVCIVIHFAVGLEGGDQCGGNAPEDAVFHFIISSCRIQRYYL
ncbi:MAG: dihydrodipicolinate synthase family protein, partial [Clostridia bacterium]|nr:dihydrodipicolinate synthase family protein [Clostridia bacterium]